MHYLKEEEKYAFNFVPMVGQRMFPVNILDFFEFVMMLDKIDESMIWHQRYGHFNFNAMKLLYTKNMVQGLPYISFEDQVCEGYIFEKQQRVPLPLDQAWRARAPLELIHADLCEPTKTPSLNGSMYFFLVVDDYTRMSWV